MYEENLHITPDPQKGYPRPDIPADEAWKNMSDLLDNAMPVKPPETPPAPPKAPPSAGGGLLGLSSQTWFIVLGVLGVVSVLTWGVIHLANRPGTSAVINDTNTAVSAGTVADTLTYTDQNTALSSGEVLPHRTVEYQEIYKNLPDSLQVADAAARPEIPAQNGNEELVVSRPGDEIKNEQEPSLFISPIAGQAEEMPAVTVPEQPVTTNRTTTIEDMPIPVTQPAYEDVPKDTIIKADFLTVPPKSAGDTMKIPDRLLEDGIIPANAAADETPLDTNKPEGQGKTKRSPGMPENLSWQIGLFGNFGEVVQKERDPNLFYGGMVTAGLWSEKLKAGIETGIGWEEYKDYGTITEITRKTDSIPLDSLGNYQYINTDTASVFEYKYRYQYLKVPLFVSKQVLTAGRFSLDIKTGPLLGFIIKKKELIYEPGPAEGEVISIDNKNYTRLDLSWQWHVILPLNWNFNEKLSLSLSPFGIFYLNNLYNRKNRPAGMLFGIGIYGGLVYRFR